MGSGDMGDRGDRGDRGSLGLSYSIEVQMCRGAEVQI